ncbi:MAG: hypothetical protein JW699_08135 [Chitinispirillaceae bacterium]|nr:hypothetical protein [Chitinispirillaceae bacterium]
MNHQHIFSAIGKLAVAGALCGAFSVSGQSTLGLNISGATYTIEKAIYGALMENYGRCIYNGVFVGTGSSVPNTRGMRNDVISGFTECGLACIEFPGGCFADNYHWADGTAMPQSSRPGGEMSNGLGTPEFYALCSLTTAQAYPTANIQNGTSSEMNAWINYIIARPYWWNITPFWKIGNEEWPPCGNYSQSQYQTKFDQFYVAEPAGVTSAKMHIMDGGSGGGWISADCQYMVNKSGPTGVSFHRYSVIDWSNKGPSSGFTQAQYYAQLQQAWGTNSSVQNYVNSMNSIDPGYKVALCVDEWGAWYNDVGGSWGTSFNWSTVRDAVIAGMHLNIFNNQCRRVKMALVAQPVNVIQALMLTNYASPYQMRKTPVFWVFKMYKGHQGATMIPVTWTNNPTNQSIPLLNASASLRGDTVRVSVVNTHYSATQSLTITFSGGTPRAGTATGQVVNGANPTSGITSITATDTASLQAYTGFTLSGQQITTTLPAHSVVMFTVPLTSAGVSAPEVVRTARDFSILSEAGGRIIVNYTAVGKTPVSLELYGVDGRTLVESFTGILDQGQKRLVWKPRSVLGSNLYIVKLRAGEVEKSERLVITK